MYLKSTIVAGALLISAPAFAQQAPQKEPANFILGHGFLQPAAPPSWDYPPGHSTQDAHASVRLDEARPERTAKSRIGADESPTKTTANR
jgi:hypothetical protein